MVLQAPSSRSGGQGGGLAAASSPSGRLLLPSGRLQGGRCRPRSPAILAGRRPLRLLPPQDARETRGALAGDPASWPGVLLRGRGCSGQMEPMRPLSWTWSLLCRLLSPGLASGATACPLRRQSCLACVPRRWWPSASKTHLSHLKFSFFYAKGRACVCGGGGGRLLETPGTDILVLAADCSVWLQCS